MWEEGVQQVRKALASVRQWIRPRKTDQIPDVYIEGNIGAGKSTLLRSLEDSSQHKVVQEPVEQWQDLNGYNFLDRVSNDGPRWAFPFQVLAATTLWESYRQNCGSPHIYERSIHSTIRVFSQVHFQQGNLEPEHMAILEKMTEVLVSQNQRPAHFVYIRTTPATAHERMRVRGRTEEAQVPLEYLQQLHDAMDQWLLSPAETNVTVIDGDSAQEAVLHETLDVLRQLGY